MSGEFVTVAAGDGGSFEAYLSRPAKGSGPGVVVLQEIFGVNQHMRDVADRYAEEGYVVLVPDLFWRLEPRVELGYEGADFDRAIAMMQRFDVDRAIDDVAAGIAHLRALPFCQGRVGAVGFCLGGMLAYLTAARTDVDCAVGYYGVGIEQRLDEAKSIKQPLLLHFGAEDSYTPPAVISAIDQAFSDNDSVASHVYEGAGHGFNCVERPSYDRPAAWMAYSRTIGLFRRVMGPHYDLSTLWDQHCGYEFSTRDVDATMATMVAEPYVNHIPTMTGGVGHDYLKRFYKNHFIPKTPADTKLIPISRTVGADRLVDEILFCFTHDIEIDWMLPGIAPTGKYVEIPLVAIVCFRGDKLYHEHIYWDQASVLVQIGVLDPAGLPIAGVETARKLADETAPSNTLMARWSESA